MKAAPPSVYLGSVRVNIPPNRHTLLRARGRRHSLAWRRPHLDYLITYPAKVLQQGYSLSINRQHQVTYHS